MCVFLIILIHYLLFIRYWMTVSIRVVRSLLSLLLLLRSLFWSCARARFLARARVPPPRVPGASTAFPLSRIFFLNVYLQLSLVVKYSLIRFTIWFPSFPPLPIRWRNRTRISARCFTHSPSSHVHSFRHVMLHVRRNTLTDVRRSFALSLESHKSFTV